MDFTLQRKIAVKYYKLIDPSLNFDGEFTFYYDETNNVRVLRLKDGKLNIDKNKDFILGGIVLSKNQKIDDTNFQQLKSTLKVKDEEELKFAQLGLRRADFLKCLQSRKMRDFLNWLKTNDISIHFKILDHLFFALADIIDNNEFIPGELINDLKTFLYVFAYENTNEFLLILEKYNYPDLTKKNYTDFFDDIISFIKNSNIPNSLQHILFAKDVLLYFLEVVKNSPKNLLFDNKQNELINEYAQLYSQNIYLLNNSLHYFDEEQQVQEKLENISINNKALTNYKFLPSHENWQIQISDIVVGLLGKFFEYIKPLTINEVITIPNQLNEHQLASFDLLKHLLISSYKKNSVFRHTSSNHDLNLKLDKLFGYNLITNHNN